MPWGEFATLLSQLNTKTPLGQIIQVRSETDNDRLKNYTPEMKKIRRDWHVRLMNKDAAIDPDAKKRMTKEFQAVMKAAFRTEQKR